MSQTDARERIILAVDTSERAEAERLAELAYNAGAKYIKLGLELSSATSWEYCSELAHTNGLEWVADAKISDIPNTTAKTVENISKLAHPPFGITIHTNSGIESMRAAQEKAGTIKMLGVTVLTSIDEKDVKRMYHVPTKAKVMELAKDAVNAGLQGVVSSPQEVGLIKTNNFTKGLFAMIPGTRSAGADTQDQARVRTPAQAIIDGADLLVIGRQITGAESPANAYLDLISEIEEVL